VQKGWIYVLVNSAMPGLAKVGRTIRPPSERAAELSSVTGVPAPFVLAFEEPFADCHAAERAIHAELDRRGLRAWQNREFFRASSTDIIRLVLRAAEGAPPPPDASESSNATALLAAAERYRLGLGDTLQDTAEAVRCYRLAAGRGALLAFERLGSLYVERHLARPDKASRTRALAPLKEGARRGDYYCYNELAALYAAEDHLANFIKCWDLFFARRAAYFLADAETDRNRFPAACRRYITPCLTLGLQPAHLAEMRADGEAIEAGQLAEIDRVRGDDEARWQAAQTLRWIHMTLRADEPAERPPQPQRRRLWPLWQSAAA
jgi:TPR repeat protein